MAYQRQYFRTNNFGGNLGVGEVVTLLNTAVQGGAVLFRGLSTKVVVFNAVIDTISAVNGFTVDESIDGGGNWENLFAATIDPADGYRKIYVKVAANDIRVRYTHGAAPSTVVRMELLRDTDERGGTP